MLNFEKNKGLLIILTGLWILFSGVIIYFLTSGGYLSTDMSNTYIVFPAGGSYHAPTGYMEYYLSQEGGGMNKYTLNHMTNFPSYIQITNGYE